MLIARALVSASQNILLDEPCSALDLGNQQVVLQLIGDLAHRQARTVLFTTHDPNHALQVASHTLLLLPEGRWLAGETADVLSETHLRQAYGLPVRLIRHAASAFLCWRRGLRCVAERHKTRLPEIPLTNVAEDKAIQGQRGGIGPETRQLVIAANIPRRRDGQGTQIVAGGQRGAIVRIADKQIRQILANKPRAGYLPAARSVSLCRRPAAAPARPSRCPTRIACLNSGEQLPGIISRRIAARRGGRQPQAGRAEQRQPVQPSLSGDRRAVSISWLLANPRHSCARPACSSACGCAALAEAKPRTATRLRSARAAGRQGQTAHRPPGQCAAESAPPAAGRRFSGFPPPAA